ncbi:PREDICTED: nucleolin 2-like [Camelina sativa]|uniref:Nucleolin 2-like n=1 Tax=Camelina sativa TaxID=90675 RepID=A0ABM0SLC7_CAMSA|nr:PREDICTED: nucleolin 2-like [Camelina sativa]
MGNLLGKRKPDYDDDDDDDLEINPILKKQKVTSEETLTEGLADDPSLQHKSDDDQEANLFGKRILEDDDDLETKPMLKKLKEISEETLITEGLALADPTSLQHKSDDDQEETMEGLSDDTPDLVEEDDEADLMKNTLCISHLSRQANIQDIIDFFKGVVHALEKKNGKRLLNRKITLDVANKKLYPLPKYSLDHKVCYEDCLGQESPVEGLADVDEEARQKTLFVSNLPSQVKTRNIISFFKDVGQVVGVRLIVDRMGKHVGCGFVEFASANEADKALEQKNGQMLRYRKSFFSKIFLDVAERAPYPIRYKYNLVEKLWYADNLLREPNLKQQEEKS